jgi:AcrR family transcriptional regulator
MGTKERRTRERIETREMILEAAREMFAEEGYDAVTMRAIAERIEYTPTAIYHHFPSKQALLTELCECDFQGLAKLFQTHAAPADPIERLRAVGNAYLRFAVDYPSQYRFMFMTVLPQLEHDAEYLEKNAENPEHNAYVFLRMACAEAIAQKRFRPEITDPDQVAQILWSNIHGLVSLRMTKKHDKFVPWKDLEATAKLSMDALLRGMLREARS